MTLYWWSHWFWITVVYSYFFFFIAVVHTYPSQKTSQENSQYQNSIQTKKLVTKLYQTSTTLSWLTGSPLTIMQSKNIDKNKHHRKVKATSQLKDGTSRTTDAESAHTKIKFQDGFDQYYYDDEEEEHPETEQIDLKDVEMEQEYKDLRSSQLFLPDEIKIDIKRSSELFSKSSSLESKGSNLKPIVAATTSTITTPSMVKRNNYTNYTEHLLNSSNTSQRSYTTEIPNIHSSIPTLISNNVTALPHVPSTPNIFKIHNDPQWLSSMVAASSSPIPVTTDVTDERFPFTLENVYKSEDFRRGENGPRSRKSKGLSAEYKHEGYYSTDPKNLLTRSASTTVNEVENEENNISSEALSVQPAYLMDVGAISAICFTVFGIFCVVGTIGIVLYRRRFLNKPQALSEPDSSVYIDDSTMRVSDNSDEMYSLDNDSFLNSLEAMTIQNYWTDTVKHTKL